MTAERLAQNLSIGLAASAAYILAVFSALLALDLFGMGDVGLGIIPTMLTAAIGYFALCVWAIFWSRPKPEYYKTRLRFYAIRFLIAGGVAGGLILLNAIGTYIKYFKH